MSSLFRVPAKVSNSAAGSASTGGRHVAETTALQDFSQLPSLGAFPHLSVGVGYPGMTWPSGFTIHGMTFASLLPKKLFNGILSPRNKKRALSQSRNLPKGSL